MHTTKTKANCSLPADDTHDKTKLLTAMSILPRPPFHSFQCHSSRAAIFPLHLIPLAHALSSLCISFAYSARPHRYNAYASMTHHSTTCTQQTQSPLPHNTFHCKFSFSRARHFILSNALLSQLSVLLHTLCLPMHIMPTSCSVLAMHNTHIPRAPTPPRFIVPILI